MTEAVDSEATPSAARWDDRLPPVLRKRWLQVLICIALVFVLVIGYSYRKINTLHQEGTDRETQLSAAYPNCQNVLGSFISTFYEQTGIADRKSEQFNLVLADAVKGRYDNGLTPATPGQPQGNQLISAIVEAYPDLSALNSYDRVLDTIASGRSEFKNCQTDLLDKLRSYDKWRKRDIIGSMFIRLAGFPSDSLRAQVGQQSVTGEAAESRMYVLVLPSDVNQAYTTGTLEPLTVPPLSSKSGG